MRRAALLAVALTSCSAADSLQGSLSDEVSLDFTSVTIATSGTSIGVSYLNAIPGTTGDDIVIEIIADTTGVDLSKGGTLNLTDTLPDGTTRGSVLRAVHDDARTQFPPMVRGTLTFNEEPAAGAKVSGSFAILFNQGGQLGGGRTVFGNFAGVVSAEE